MNEKLLEIAELAGFYTDDGEIKVAEKRYRNIVNYDISDKLGRFYSLAQANAVTNDEKKHDLHSHGQQIFGLKPLFDSPDKVNEKLLEFAKKSGFDISDGHITQHGMDSDLILNKMLTKFAELVQFNSTSSAEAKLVTAIQLLQELENDWNARNWGYNINIRPKIQAFLKQDK